jgi:hypothetical protein
MESWVAKIALRGMMEVIGEADPEGAETNRGKEEGNLCGRAVASQTLLSL